MKEKIYKWIAWILPRQLVMWASVRLIAHATQGVYGHTIVPDLRVMEALKRWDESEEEAIIRILAPYGSLNIKEN